MHSFTPQATHLKIPSFTHSDPKNKPLHTLQFSHTSITKISDFSQLQFQSNLHPLIATIPHFLPQKHQASQAPP